MCGIVGIVNFKHGGLCNDDIEVFQQLLISNVLRGPHSTGAFQLKQKGIGASLLKMSSHPLDYLTTEASKDFFKSAFRQGMGIVGHNRFATRGEISPRNAHPFRYEDIILVHNGTLVNHNSFPEFSKNKLEVDSNLLPVLLQEHMYEEVFERINGAFAIVFYDRRSGTLNLIRNKERPLFIGLDHRNDRLIISSEADMAKWIMKRNSYCPDTTMLDTAPGTMYKFDLTNNVADYRTQDYKLYTFKSHYTPPVSNLPAIIRPNPDRKVVPITQSTGSYSLGKEIHFIVKEAVPVGDRVLLKGHILRKPELRVVTHVSKETALEFEKSDIGVGKVVRIKVYETPKNGNTHLFEVSDSKISDLLMTKNYHFRTAEEVKQICWFPCAACNGELKEEEIEDIVYNDKTEDAFCPQCSRTQMMDVKHKHFPFQSMSH